MCKPASALLFICSLLQSDDDNCDWVGHWTNIELSEYCIQWSSTLLSAGSILTIRCHLVTHSPDLNTSIAWNDIGLNEYCIQCVVHCEAWSFFSVVNIMSRFNSYHSVPSCNTLTRLKHKYCMEWHWIERVLHSMCCALWSLVLHLSRQHYYQQVQFVPFDAILWHTHPIQAYQSNAQLRFPVRYAPRTI